MTQQQERALITLIAMCIGKECLCDVYAKYKNAPCLRCATLDNVKQCWPELYAGLCDAFIRNGYNRGV